MIGNRQRLTSELRKSRMNSGLTQHEVATHMDWSMSKVIRVENGSVRVSIIDLRALLKLYKVIDEEYIESLVQLAKQSKKYSLQKFREIIPSQFRFF